MKDGEEDGPGDSSRWGWVPASLLPAPATLTIVRVAIARGE